MSAAAGQKQQPQSHGWSEQGTTPRADAVHPQQMPQQTPQQSWEQSPRGFPAGPARDEWGRLVLPVPAQQLNGHGKHRQSLAKEAFGQNQQADGASNGRDSIRSSDTILWVREDAADKQEQGMPIQGAASDAVSAQQGHGNGKSRNAAPAAKLRLRHRRFQREAVSREALLDNVE